jgi:hypothetical protein
MSQRGCLPIACLPGGQPVLTQLRAIEILLRKSIPDLAAAEIKSEQTYRYVVELPPVLSCEEWQRKYGQNRGFGNEPAENLQQHDVDGVVCWPSLPPRLRPPSRTVTGIATQPPSSWPTVTACGRASWLRCAGTTSSWRLADCTFAGPRAGMPAASDQRPGKPRLAPTATRSPASPYVFVSGAWRVVVGRGLSAQGSAGWRQLPVPDPLAHAAPWLRLQAGQRWTPYPSDPRVPWASVDPIHSALHRACAGSLQGLLAGLSGRLR